MFWIKDVSKECEVLELEILEKLSKEAEKILIDRFGKDSIIALATTVDAKPYVRSVNSFYESGSFYVLTYSLSNKMKYVFSE